MPTTRSASASPDSALTSAPEARHGRPWLSRLLAHRWFKITMAIWLNGAVLSLYFLAQHFPLRTPLVMPRFWLDWSIPFRPGWTPVYLSLYIFNTLGPLWLETRADLQRFARGALWIGLTGAAFFFFWPTLAPRPAHVEVNWSYRLMVQWDTPGNACPSLHAAFVLYSAAWAARAFASKIWLVFVWAWGAAILYATIATRQHVLLDLTGGAMLAGIVLSFGNGPSRVDLPQKSAP